MTGTIEILRYACVEDTGRVINPLIVEGQVLGAIAQGIGGALTEHLVYDAAGQLLTGTLMEYALPTAAAIPADRLRRRPAPRGALTRGTAVEYPRASCDPMRRPPLVLVGLVVIALGETAGAVMSQLPT